MFLAVQLFWSVVWESRILKYDRMANINAADLHLGTIVISMHMTICAFILYVNLCAMALNKYDFFSFSSHPWQIDINHSYFVVVETKSEQV